MDQKSTLDNQPWCHHHPLIIRTLQLCQGLLAAVIQLVEFNMKGVGNVPSLSSQEMLWCLNVWCFRHCKLLIHNPQEDIRTMTLVIVVKGSNNHSFSCLQLVVICQKIMRNLTLCFYHRFYHRITVKHSRHIVCLDLWSGLSKIRLARSSHRSQSVPADYSRERNFAS